MMRKTSFHPTPRGAVQMSDEQLLKVLTRTFGHRNFRPLQKDVVQRILKGHDSLVVLPTGGGKSLCYQLPAVILRGVALVVSPLIALMQDQVNSLVQAGIQAAALSSMNSDAENKAILEGLEEAVPRYKVLYITPERLSSRSFDDILQILYDSRMISLLAVDEAHCISSWGHDFRPAFRQMKFVRGKLRGVPCLALTATANAQVRDDILTQLSMEHAPLFMASFNRPNIHYEIVYKDILENAMEELTERVKAYGSKTSGIVYCQKRETCEYLAGALLYQGVSARPYHAGLSDQDRAENQEAWISGRIDVVCATIAFGMGIDKPDVRFVIHWNMPKTMEGFYQESGRAGRDGYQSDSLVFYSKNDFEKFKFIISKAAQDRAKKRQSSEARAAQMLGSLTKVKQFCETAHCRRIAILSFFGEQILNHGFCMKTCDYCKNKIEVQEKIDKVQAAQFNCKPPSMKNLKASMKTSDYEWTYVDDIEDSEGEFDKEEEDSKEAERLIEGCSEVTEEISEPSLWDRLDALEQMEQGKKHSTEENESSKSVTKKVKKRTRFWDQENGGDQVPRKKVAMGQVIMDQNGRSLPRAPKSALKKCPLPIFTVSQAEQQKIITKPNAIDKENTAQATTNAANIEQTEASLEILAINEGDTTKAGLGLKVKRRRRLIKQLLEKMIEVNGSTFEREKLLKLAIKSEYDCFTKASKQDDYKARMIEKLQKAHTRLKPPKQKVQQQVQEAPLPQQISERFYFIEAIEEERTGGSKLGLTVEKRRRLIEQMIEKLTNNNPRNLDRFEVLEMAKQMEYECFSQSSKKAVYKVMINNKIRQASKQHEQTKK